MSAADAVLWALVCVVTLLADFRWLRVAQREHYAAGRVGAMTALWCRVRAENVALLAAAAVLVVAGAATRTVVGSGLSAAWALSLSGVLVLTAWPVGLSLRPTSSPLARTPRLRRVAAVLLVLEGLLLFGSRRPEFGALVPLLSAPITDGALWLVAPVERRLGHKYVRSAQARLRRVRPTVVAITGSYGKTSTKNYANHLIGQSQPTAASPASFNNLMGLSRAVNDGLPDGTEVFLAEMGTYGPGEIRALCEIFTPDVSAIITIGEAHLERMKDRATIVAAKSEITERPGTVVLNVDVPELADLADRLAGTKRVIRASTAAGSSADAVVAEKDDTWSVWANGDYVADVAAPPTGHPINLAIAVGLALAVGVVPRALARALTALPTAPHRAEVGQTDGGVTVIDDTYNANPTGADQALRAARELAGDGHRIFTITPGMVELGSRQAAANSDLAAAATAAANMVLAVTGRTNRSALLAGARGPGEVRCYPDRTRAAAAVLAEARPGDVLVYENDLPDHYP